VAEFAGVRLGDFHRTCIFYRRKTWPCSSAEPELDMIDRRHAIANGITKLEHVYVARLYVNTVEEDGHLNWNVWNEIYAPSTRPELPPKIDACRGNDLPPRREARTAAVHARSMERQDFLGDALVPKDHGEGDASWTNVHARDRETYVVDISDGLLPRFLRNQAPYVVDDDFRTQPAFQAA
jgi:hypothetical protein